MKLTVQKRLAAALFKSSQKRVWFDEDMLDEIKESITKQDIKALISQGAIRLKPENATSKSKVRQRMGQKAKGLRKGHGSRKGAAKARLPKKDAWMGKIRSQRNFIKNLREKGHLDATSYRNLYRKTKGGFFRSTRHIKLYCEENDLFQNKK
ncbi:50S ribosomal protein L19e [Nanoarchaeota archaeon]